MNVLRDLARCHEGVHACEGQAARALHAPKSVSGAHEASNGRNYVRLDHVVGLSNESLGRCIVGVFTRPNERRFQ